MVFSASGVMAEMKYYQFHLLSPTTNRIWMLLGFWRALLIGSQVDRLWPVEAMDSHGLWGDVSQWSTVWSWLVGPAN